MYKKDILFILLCLTLFISCKNSPLLKQKQKFYSSGELKSKYYTVKGNKEGEYISFYRDGAIKQKAEYRDGKLNGLVRRYYPNGNIQWEVPYIMGKEHGCFKKFTEKGNIQSIIVYYNGKSLDIQFYTDGNVKSFRRYKGGLRDGQGYFFYPNGYQKMYSMQKQDSSVYYIEHDKLGRIKDEYRAILVNKNKDTYCLDKELQFEISVKGPRLKNSSLYGKLTDRYIRKPNDMDKIELDSLGNALYKTSANKLGVYYLILHFIYDEDSEKIFGADKKVIINECK